MRECCKDPRNLVLLYSSSDKKQVKQCSVCQARHYHVVAEPGKLGAIFK